MQVHCNALLIKCFVISIIKIYVVNVIIYQINSK